MAPVYGRRNTAISGQVLIMGQPVEGLIDTGASVSCISHELWRKNRRKWGSLDPLPTAVLGADGSPLDISGITRALPVEWGGKQVSATFMVVRGLARPQALFGMDILPEFQILIDTQHLQAQPRDHPPPRTTATISHSQKIPPMSVLRVQVPNPWPRETVMFTPSPELPPLISGTPTVSEGATLTLAICNRREEPYLLQPGWTLGALESVRVVQNPSPTPTLTLPSSPPHLTPQQDAELQHLLQEYGDVFSQGDHDLGRTHLLEHEIHTKGPPIRLPQRRQNPAVRKEEACQIEEMLQNGVIRPSSSPWASPVVMVRKKNGSLSFRVGCLGVECFRTRRLKVSISRFAIKMWSKY